MTARRIAPENTAGDSGEPVYPSRAMPAARHATPILAKNACDAVTSQAFCHGISVWMPTKPGPHKVGRRGCAVTSILRSKILAQGQFTCPEHVRFPWDHRERNPKIRPSAKGRWSYFWRSGWDSNPREVSLKLISSHVRYDHFDTSPCMLTRETEINASIQLY